MDEDFARYYWPHGSALGQHLFAGGEATTDAQAFTVVGVVGAVKQAGLTDQAAQGAVYYPYALLSLIHISKAAYRTTARSRKSRCPASHGGKYLSLFGVRPG